MAKGSPKITTRMPAPVLAALRQLAEDRNKTPSDILRDLTIQELKRTGYSIDPAEEDDSIA